MMAFYLDEDLSPKIAVILRKNGIEAGSAHEAGMIAASDREQLEWAARQKKCLVTKNRNDFIRLTQQFINDHRPHAGMLIVLYSLPGDQFARIALPLKIYASRHPAGLEPYQVDFLSSNIKPEPS